LEAHRDHQRRVWRRRGFKRRNRGEIASGRLEGGFLYNFSSRVSTLRGH